MVNEAQARQFSGFDLNDYVFIDSSANVFGANNIGFYVVGTQANVIVPFPPNIAALMAAVPPPGPGLPITNIGPQFPWPAEGNALAQPANVPALQPNLWLNPSPAHRTLIRVINQNMNIAFFDQRMAVFLIAFLAANPAAALAGPTAGFWPMPVFETLQVQIQPYQFERKWIWMFWQRTVADADGDLELWIEG